MNSQLVIAHVLLCFFMCGLIWVIQIVHYPAFQSIDPKLFTKFHSYHSVQMGWLAGLPMIAELMTGIALWWENSRNGLWQTNLIVILLTWAATFLLSVPAHLKLKKGYSVKEIKFLVYSNWLRTLAWTGRSVFLAKMFLSQAAP